MTETLSIALEDAPVPAVGALFDGAAGNGAAILLAHGSGVDMHHEFMAAMAAELSQRGHPVLRFRYPYMQRMVETGGRRPPDRMGPLITTHRAAARALAERTPDRAQVWIGKSMGGRVASYLCQAGHADTPCDGLAFLGYPLHPQGKPEKLRKEHFAELHVPALFLQGTRDGLADLELLRPALEEYAGRATLEVVEGADHGFEVLRSIGMTPAEVRADLADRIERWLAAEL